MLRRTRTANLPSLAAALLLFLSQTPHGQTVQTRRLPGDEPPAPPRPGLPRVRLRAEPEGEVFALAFSPDGRVLAVSTINRVVKLWSTETGELVRSIAVKGGPVSKLLWSPDGRVLATEDAARAFQFWDAETGEPKARTGAHRRPITQTGWAAGHAALLTLDDDRRLRAWETSEGRLLYERRLKGLSSLTFAPGGDAVLAFREYERPELLDPLTGSKKSEVGTQHVWPFFGAWLARFSPDGRRLLFRDGRKRLKLRDVAAGAEEPLQFGRDDHQDYFAAEFSRDGRRLALVREPFRWGLSTTCEVRLYDVEASALLPAALKAKGFGNIFKVVWSEDGGMVVTAGEADPALFEAGRLTAYAWRVADGAPYAAFPLEENRRGFATRAWENADTVELLAGGRVLLAYNDDSVKFWDARTGQRLYRREADRVAVSPDRRLVAVASDGGTRAQIWEAVAP
ncbi:MAG TPA: WD40 repeat domain-containing protein [Pyrinomonadaceae bacterium]|jgi:WD40 repeat protein